jgi:NAD(P)-dependent dehydrogenase (short-subunit alcohol dehydrogenase family)
VVTGASRGLGRAIATHLAGRGVSLALCARDARALHAVAEDLRARHGVGVHAVPADVGDAAAMAAFAESSRTEIGHAHALVTNAGVLGPVGRIDAVDVQAWSDAVTVNVLGVVHAMRAFVPQMIERGDGVVLNVLGGGVGGDGVQSFIDAYVASKGAIAVLTESTAAELEPQGVRVNAFSPGPLATELMRPVLEAGREASGGALFETAHAMYADQREDAVEPEVFELIDFLLSDEARPLTGRLLSARWNRVDELRRDLETISTPSRYRMRRIDADLFLARDDVSAD